MANKKWQADAERANLEHIADCGRHMLDDMHFKREFVAKIMLERLNIAMFGYGDKQISIAEGQYQPSSMWDFWEDRTAIRMEVIGKDKLSGEFRTPTKTRKKFHNKTSVLEYSEVSNGETEQYKMPDGLMTPGIRDRFRQYLASNAKKSSGKIVRKKTIDEVTSCAAGVYSDIIEVLETTNVSNDQKIKCEEILRNAFAKAVGSADEKLDQNTPPEKIPAGIMFLVGMQFGQINKGSWNPFAVAAKKYLAL
ncbi:MAG: hypothetical protein LBI47_01925 [Puniceicoccales bacterium]|jgi:hypothetical protein|nr:hypothetical protein [Puniceicoccales bacterium]